MRTIEFSNDDIKECKIALVNQNLTPLQSAFLMQYITNLQQALIDINSSLKRLQNKILGDEKGDELNFKYFTCIDEIDDIIYKVLGDEK